MFQAAVHEQQVDTPQGDRFSRPNPQVLPPNQNTDLDAIKSIRLNTATFGLLFFARNSMA
jgi:hypothetical protein